jgi:hypothetical protein
MGDLGVAPPAVKVFKAFHRHTHGLGAILLQPGSGLLAELFEIAHGVTSFVAS